MLAGLNHRHILPVYYLHQTSTALAMVMRYEPWGDLASALPHLNGSQRVSVLIDVAAGLQAAHGRDIVHRDLKPANILSDEYGRAVLADFGLARLPRLANGFRTVGLTVTGTPLYLAPEQIRSPQLEAPSIDHYAFGILSYQMLVGRWPYPNPTWRTVESMHLHAETINPLTVQPGLSPQVADTLLGLLAKDQRRRRTAQELAVALSGVPAAEWDALIPGKPRLDTLPEAVVETGVYADLETVETAFGRSSQTTQTAHAVAPPEPAASIPAAHEGNAVEWVVPTVYRPSRRSSRRLHALLVLVLSLLLGVLAYVVWMTR